MKMRFSSESSYIELTADKFYTSKMLALNMINNRISASKMCEKNCNSEKKLSVEDLVAEVI